MPPVNEPPEPSNESPEPFHVRIVGVLWAMCALVILSDLLLGYPPPFPITVAVGSMLGLGIELHARELEQRWPGRDARDDPGRRSRRQRK